MSGRLPPLFTLQAFEAAVRLGGFSRAAQELHLTPGAVSRQIRLLEQACGSTLFVRKGNAMELTPEGHALLARLGGPLASLQEAFWPEPAELAPSLQIATLGSLARAWLVPRLGRFLAQAPQVRLTVHTDYTLVKPPPRYALVALRHGLDDGSAELLFADRLLAVAAPAVAAALGRRPQHWPSDRVLQHVTSDAPAWFEAAGVEVTPTAPAFNDAGIVLDAAEAGLGITITRLSLALPRLQQGSLVAAHPLLTPARRANLLVVREDSERLAVVRQFTRWARAEAKSTQDELERYRPA